MRHGLFPQPAEGTVEPGAIPDSAVPVVAAPPLDLLRKIKVTAIVYGIGRPSYAILEDLATQKQALYRVGDQVPGVGDVRRIERQAVVVGRGRQEGSVPFLRDAEPAVPPSQ
jgi:hypothetical protein